LLLHLKLVYVTELYSTIIIQTGDINLLLEYKQDHERCDAHSIDVWISSFSPALVGDLGGRVQVVL